MWLQSSGTLEMSTVKIHRSHYSYIYLLSPLRSDLCTKCHSPSVCDFGHMLMKFIVPNNETLTFVEKQSILVSLCIQICVKLFSGKEMQNHFFPILFFLLHLDKLFAYLDASCFLCAGL